jgi:hypothetical protein
MIFFIAYATAITMAGVAFSNPKILKEIAKR